MLAASIRNVASQLCLYTCCEDTECAGFEPARFLGCSISMHNANTTCMPCQKGSYHTCCRDHCRDTIGGSLTFLSIKIGLCLNDAVVEALLSNLFHALTDKWTA
jgi:hypothetical protein